MQLMSAHFISNLGWGNTHKNLLFSQSLILIYFRVTCSWLIWITIHGQFKKKNIVFWQFPMRIKILYLIMFIQDSSLNKFFLHSAALYSVQFSRKYHLPMVKLPINHGLMSLISYINLIIWQILILRLTQLTYFGEHVIGWIEL